MPEIPSKWNTAAIDEAKAARRRSSWTPFETPTQEELALIADLLGFSKDSLRITVARGLLFCASCREGHRAFVISDSRKLSAVAYRLDGSPWEQTKRIAHVLPGSIEGWPVGIAEASTFPTIALVCGAPDLLAVLHLAWCDTATPETLALGKGINLIGNLGVVAMLSAENAILPSALPHFKDKKVRIFSHDDTAGRNSASLWAFQLTAVGLAVDGFSFAGLIQADGPPVNDLNDFVRLHPNLWESERELVPSTFSFVPTATPQINRKEHPHACGTL